MCTQSKEAFLANKYAVKTRSRHSKREVAMKWRYVDTELPMYTIGKHGFGLFISFFDAWRQRRNLGIRLELTILYFFAKKHSNVVKNVV
jgi:hypothetical protein